MPLPVSMLTAPGYRKAVAGAAEQYRNRREAFCRRLVERGIDVESRSGLNVWVPVEDEAAVVSAMERDGYAIRSGASFRLDAPPGVRVTVARHGEDELVGAADALADAMATRPARRGA